MTISGYKLNKKQLLIAVILIVGLIALVYLIGQQQILRGRADVNPETAFEIKAADGSDGTKKVGPASYETNTQNIKIQLKDPSILNQ
jgi:hypothetical protein